MPDRMVTRDFIPAREPRTLAEEERQKQLRAMGAGRVRMDFIPAAGAPAHVMGDGHEKQATEAIDRAMAAQESAAREMFQDCVTKLKGLTVADAIEHITQAPFSVQEMLVVAERMHGNRKSILARFGEPDPAAVERWAALMSGAPNEASAGDVTASSADAEE